MVKFLPLKGILCLFIAAIIDPKNESKNAYNNI